MRLLAVAAAAGVVFAMPLAGAVGWGVDAAHVVEMKNAGATPAYGQTWVGLWMKKSGWGGFESQLRTMRDNGVTPVIMWYYWGDSISQNCVKYGCDGRSKWDWDNMARDLANRADAIMGGKTYYIVLEPEFNKQGIPGWETFDGYLEAQARMFRAEAPGAKLVVGFGYWGGWDSFDRAVAASDYTGFQILRGSTRDSSTVAINAADQMISVSKQLKGRFGKSVVVFDLGIATYGGWEWVQEASLKRVIAKSGEMDAAGIKFVVWRYVYDNNYSSGYFGPAESTWGVKYSWGGKKAAYDELVTLIKGGSGAETGGSYTPPATSAPTTSNPFSGVSGNNWWVQAKASGSPSSVTASVNGGSPVALKWQSWGAWAVSTYMPTGSVVTLTAKYGDGSTRSASYSWPSATLTSGGTTSGSTGGFDAKFRDTSGNDWWVQVYVDGNQAVSKVEARVNGGSWVALSKRSWGAWATSTHAPDGSRLEFRATSSTGATDTSGAYTW